MLTCASDDEWDYCDESCDGSAGGDCSVTVSGHACDSWGENEFGLEPTSTTCEQVDGLDKPWCYYGEGDDQWDFCDCTSSAGPDKSDRAQKQSADAGGWQPTDKTDENGNPLQRINMKDLMLQGKITRWWWDAQNPSSTRLTDQNFDYEVGNHDYYVSSLFWQVT